jgi:4-amino-4-deoxy-L-arabinose transferase-like glycosyltransferase
VSTGTPAPSGLERRALLVIVVVTTGLRLLVALLMPALDDETHYWVWSRHLMWGYPDHPPVIAGLVAAGTWLLGDSPFAIRLGTVLLGTASTLAAYALARRLFSPAAGLRAALLMQAVPALAASGIMAAPDGPLGFVWLLAMLATWMATRGASWAWPVAGAAAGLAIQCKLAGGALAVGLAGFVLGSAAQRRWLRTPGPYLAMLTGLLVILPLVVWNAGHDWATLQRALHVDPWVTPTTVAGNVLRLVGSQFVFYAPLGFPILVAGLVDAGRYARRDERFQLLLWCALPTLGAVLAASAHSLAKPHYTGPALLAGLIAAAGVWPQWRAQRFLRAGLATSAALTLAVYLLVSVPTPLSVPLHEPAQGWERVGAEVERLLPMLGPPGQVFVLTADYQAASQILFATKNRVPVVTPFRGFALWEPPSAWIDRNGLLVDHLGGRAYARLSLAFDRLEAPFVVPLRPGMDVKLFPGVRFRGF